MIASPLSLGGIASAVGVVLAHEFGHYVASVFHRVDASLPYFLPAPTFTGTLGAFMKWVSSSVTATSRVLGANAREPQRLAALEQPVQNVAEGPGVLAEQKRDLRVDFFR